MGSIHFFNEDVNFKITNKLQIKRWIKEIIASEQSELSDLNFIFCSDTYLHSLNVQFLNHDDYTDILTFDKSEDENLVSGDIYISIERIKENANLLQQDVETELKRVMIHGVLHLLGFSDKEPAEKELMTQKENEALDQWSNTDVPRGTSKRGTSI